MGRSRSALLAVATISLTLTVSTLAVPSAVAEDTSPQPRVAVQSVGGAPADLRVAETEAALLADAETIAQIEGRPATEVVDDLHWQTAVQEEIDRLWSVDPGAFAGSRISHADRSVWVGFTGAAPRSNFPAETQAQLASDLPLSHDELAAAALEATTTADQVFGGESVARADEETGTIEIFVGISQTADADAKVALIRSAVQSLTGGQADVVVMFDPNATGGVEDAYGGARLEYTSSGSLKCTSAFSVIRNSARSMLTAQHCTLPFTHENSSGSTEYSASHVASHYGSNGDMRRYNTSTVERPKFRANYSDLRTIYSAPGFSEGTYMCHFGRGNGKSCDKVYDTTVSKGDLGSLIATERHKTTGGNSGGPWFYGTSGFGIHHGYKTIWFRERSLFTPLNRVGAQWSGTYILVG